MDGRIQTAAGISARPRRRRLFVAVALVFLAAMLSLGGIGWLGSERAIHPKPQHYQWSLAQYPDLRPEAVSFVSRNRTRIAGLFFPGKLHATIILSHGYGDNQEQMLPYAAFLHKSGFTVFTYDMRNRGHSGGDAVTLGALEPADLVSAIDYLASRSDIDSDRIGALGVSLGASTTILAAAQDRRIKAIVDDSGFSDAPGVIASSFEHFVGLPAFPFAPITVAMAEWRAKVDLKRVRPVDAVCRSGPRPIFIIHCTGDRFVPPEHSQRIYDAASDPKQLWWIPTGGHIDGIAVAPAEYQRRVVAFLAASLHYPPRPPPGASPLLR